MKPIVCKHCSAINKHYSFQCHTQRKPIKPKVGDIYQIPYIASNGEDCIGDFRITSITPTNKTAGTTKKSKPINKVSDKEKKRQVAYKSVRAYYLSLYPECQAKLDNCQKEATDIHHMKGRTGDLLLNTQFFLSTCRGCHLWIESHPTQSKELGLSFNRLDK